ncbi:MAG: ATP-binding protein [Candidatus Sulfotelmatobacter sp.]
MKMTIIPRADGITHVVLAGRLDSNAAEEISESFFQATVARGQSAIVDLSEVDFMVSRGIGLFLINGGKLRKAGHTLVVLNPQALVKDGLKTTRADRVTPIASDWDEAIRLVHGGSAAATTANRPLTATADKSESAQAESELEVPSVLEGELKLEIKNEVAELKTVMTTLAEFLEVHRVPHRAAYATSLAVDELVMNVIRYAYVDDDAHTIGLDLAIREGQIILRFVDDGRPFDPRTGPALDLNAEERQAGGMGLLLVLDMVDVLTYQRVNERNCVEVRIRLFEDKPSDQ